jgi:hypothetical protein
MYLTRPDSNREHKKTTHLAEFRNQGSPHFAQSPHFSEYQLDANEISFASTGTLANYVTSFTDVVLADSPFS